MPTSGRRRWRWAAPLAALLALGMGLAGCAGGSPKAAPSSSGSSEAQLKGIKYAKCIRSHGEPEFPDPNGQGMIVIINPKGILRARSPQFERAQAACKSLFSGFNLQFVGPHAL